MTPKRPRGIGYVDGCGGFRAVASYRISTARRDRPRGMTGFGSSPFYLFGQPTRETA